MSSPVSSPAAMWTDDGIRKCVSAATRRLAAGEDTGEDTRAQWPIGIFAKFEDLLLEEGEWEMAAQVGIHPTA